MAVSDGREAKTSSPMQRLFDSFATATGWELHLFESAESTRRRAGDPNTPPMGEIRIVDMSADWPAGKPTAHRGDCDELAAVISAFLNRPQNL